MVIEICSYSVDSIKRWSGGTTQELYIFPKSASLPNRDFDFRISTATVEESESTFSSFPGYLRKLLVLEGELEINHQENHSVSLKPYEQDAFSGDWNTTSKGQVRDFNVIYKPHLNPVIEVKNFNSEKYEITDSKNVYVYVWKGECFVDNNQIGCRAGFFSSEIQSCNIQIRNECTLIFVKIE